MESWPRECAQAFMEAIQRARMKFITPPWLLRRFPPWAGVLRHNCHLVYRLGGHCACASRHPAVVRRCTRQGTATTLPTSTSHALGSWSAGEVALGGAFVLALDIDRKQTLAELAAGLKETNPIVGYSPSAGRVNTYAISLAIVGLGAAAVIPRGGWRAGFLAFLVGGEAAAVGRAVRIGFPIRI